MMDKSRVGWRRIRHATGYSMRGLKAAWRNEAAFRQELVIILILLPVTYWVGDTMTQRAVLIFPLMVVLVVELLNSAIETAIDRIGLEHHRLSGRAKDMGSAAVMISLLAAGIVWGLMIYQKWFSN